MVAKRAEIAPVKSTTQKRAKQKVAPPHYALALHAWASGVPSGINHAYRGMGKQRHLTAAAQSWGQAVVFAVTKAQRDQQLAEVDWSGAPLAVRLHYFVAITRFKTGRTRKLDIDAPVKHTLDRAMEALGVDDAQVVSLEVIQTTLDEAPRPGGYGPTRQGCWIDVVRLGVRQVRDLDGELPGGAWQ